jgi:DNA repair protein RecO (recombination protein O)
MIAKTNGIALGTIKFRETSIITRIFTEKFGLQSYLINGIRAPKGKFKIALFQPLTLLELVVYHKENAGIQRLSEAKCSYPYSSVSSNIRKSAIMIFLTEILEKTLREGSNPEVMYSFLRDSFKKFDKEENEINTFHLRFLFEFSKFLGFRPSSIDDFNEHIPLALKESNPETLELIQEMIAENFQKTTKSNNATRRNCLNLIIAYYRSHIANFGEVKSIGILREILD